ncbi:hypothetical protein [Leptothoe sp. PORK10 BA2]|uniref:hypothetical protein n=1 Tax=Leptothoe sp. PORK10 BA2 TaxID=3110254 RepID=UPI002B213943|nr:hypothetical protein [Leptothoe sp. PORK10 BA2]MEA5464764.1 hypothetical protein [Leptothoe sp. PORK10 BA2]
MLALFRPAACRTFKKGSLKMHIHHQDEVKVAVYAANMPTDDQQHAQDLLLAVLMALSAAAVLGLRFLF